MNSNKQPKARANLHGLLLIDKPSGMTSHDVVSRIRRIASTKEVGHSGTLDPLASGLMVVLLGEATKLSSIVTEGDKSYEVEVCLGIETDTLDITGEITKTNEMRVNQFDVLATALNLQGEMSLPIPLYSAKKIDGQKLYEYARQGQAVEIPEKIMKFWNIENRSVSHKIAENKYSFHLSCSKGSFIRSWVKLLGEKLGCGATMTALKRTKSHDFYLNQAQALDVLLQQKDEGTLDLPSLLLPIKDAIARVKTIKVSGHDEVLLGNGQISHDLRSKLIILFKPDSDEWVFAISQSTKQVMAIIGLESGVGFKIKRGFKY